MKPRKSLNKILEASIEAGGITNPENITEPFAIGRWVSVEERLPDNGARCVVRGHDNKLFCADHFCNGIWDKYGYEPTVTHWLDLDLPSGKEEA